MKGFLLDTSYLFALYGKDKNTQSAIDSFQRLFSRSGTVLLVPWPVMYESFNTRFSGELVQVAKLKSDWAGLLKMKRLDFVDDTPYREVCFEAWQRGGMYRSTKRFRGLSFVDMLLMDIMNDKGRGIEGLLTFDLRDFSSFCAKRKIEIIPGT